jgi:hypothetical protein
MLNSVRNSVYELVEMCAHENDTYAYMYVGAVVHEDMRNNLVNPFT